MHTLACHTVWGPLNMAAAIFSLVPWLLARLFPSYSLRIVYVDKIVRRGCGASCWGCGAKNMSDSLLLAWDKLGILFQPRWSHFFLDHCPSPCLLSQIAGIHLVLLPPTDLISVNEYSISCTPQACICLSLFVGLVVPAGWFSYTGARFTNISVGRPSHPVPLKVFRGENKQRAIILYDQNAFFWVLPKGNFTVKFYFISRECTLWNNNKSIVYYKHLPVASHLLPLPVLCAVCNCMHYIFIQFVAW
jgi:hypothetical protein